MISHLKDTKLRQIWPQGSEVISIKAFYRFVNVLKMVTVTLMTYYTGEFLR